MKSVSFISKNSNIVIRGKGENTPYIYDDYVNSDYPVTVEALLRLQKAHADWRILSTDAVENEIIDNEAFLNSIKTKPDKSVVEIKFFDDTTDEAPGNLPQFCTHLIRNLLGEKP